MVDKSLEIFAVVKDAIEGINIQSQNVDIPAVFPTVTIDEVSNIPIEEDDNLINEYASVRYKVQVFTTGDNKRQEARSIYSKIDEALQKINLKAKTFSTIPEIYNSKIYQIEVDYEAVIRNDGVIFRS